MRMNRLIESIERSTRADEPLYESRTMMSFAVAAGLPRGSMGERVSDQEELENLYLIADKVVRDILPIGLRRNGEGGFAKKLENLPPIESVDFVKLAIRRIGAVTSNGDLSLSGDSEKVVADNPQMMQVLRMVVEGLTKTYIGARKGRDGEADSFSMRKTGSEAGTAFGAAVDALAAATPSASNTIRKSAKYVIVGKVEGKAKNNPYRDDAAGSSYDPADFMEDTGSTRSIRDIAKEIQQDWTKVNYAAKPYLSAMMSLDKITDTYYADDAESVIRYFLSNATSWRGETAKRIKAELNKLLK